ncbi:surface glycan-binding family protein [Pseudopedobacter sp.]|uniref:surface glycan-binding family protein n=1 Tax=Pseudopedobacter sp. TaxID=1936787 RepID=UPI0033426EA1
MNPVNTKLKLSGYLSWVLVLLLVTAGCKKTEVTDNTEFAIYYTGMTDIGPSMNGIIAAPSYIGGMPNNFEIVQITLDGEPYTGSSFEINQDNGGVSIKETTGMSVGLYKLTISCYANGTRYEFKDAVAVNMMKPVPDGITVTPNKLTASYSDVIDANSTVELPTAQVTTDNNHVSIRKYEIAKSDFSKYFAISSTGTISIIRGDLGLLPGKYVLSLKLTTGASGEDEGIFENAIEIDITSKPLGLTYEPASGKLEEESALSGKTSYTSTAPKLKGSLDNVQYTIKNISPATDKIKINAQTGVITVAENHGLTAGQQYKVTVNVKNVYDQAGVDFADVFELDVVEFIEPIQNFTYQNKNATQAVAFTAGPDAGFKGDEVRFEFVDLPAALQGKVTLNSQGVVSALKGNSIPIGNYTVKVKATNPKGESTASFTLAVVANPNYFTYVRYGNNLNLTPAENYANQFRIAAGGALTDVSPTPTTDANVSLTYEIRNIHQGVGTTIDSETGKITLKGISAPQCGIFMVTAIAGKGTPEEYSVQTPVFVHFSSTVAPTSNSSQLVKVEYSPFVFQVNPNKGGRSAKPVIAGVNDMSKFTLDYRRTFNYYNFFGSGTYANGQPNVANSFLHNLWDSYAESRGINPNYGSRDPLSYYANKSNTSLTLAYVDPNTFELVVNPNKWIADGEPANGAMIGQITFETNGSDPQNGGQIFPIILWFDTKF